MNTKEKTVKELESGLSSFVEIYKLQRSAGNLMEAISMRDAIKKIIKNKGLIASLVWGSDPDDKEALVPVQ